MKRLILFILLGFVAGVICSMLVERYMVYDSIFFRRCADTSDAWAAKLREQGRPCVVFAGGSETRMGVDPAIMHERMGVAAINAAGNAGFSFPANVVAALPYLRPGDTLVLCCHSLSSLRDTPTSAGLKFCFLRQGFGLFSSGIIAATPKNISTLTLGNVSPLVVALSRQFAPYEKRYRYHSGTILHPSGWVEVQQRRMQGARCQEKNIRELGVISAHGIEDFIKLQQLCRERGVELVVHMPVAFSGSYLKVFHAQAACIFTQAGIPVLKDHRLGVISDSFYFADTGAHLSPFAARENSLIIARALREKSYWTAEELTATLRRMGWYKDLPTVGSPAGK